MLDTTKTTPTPVTTSPACPFTSREEYLAYRIDWRATYKQLSADIRVLKQAIKNGMRAKIATGIEQNKLSCHSSTATEMLMTLAEYRAAAKAISAAKKAAR